MSISSKDCVSSTSPLARQSPDGKHHEYILQKYQLPSPLAAPGNSMKGTVTDDARRHSPVRTFVDDQASDCHQSR